MEAFDDFGNFDSATPQPSSFATNSNGGFGQPKAAGTEDDWTEEEQALMA